MTCERPGTGHPDAGLPSLPGAYRVPITFEAGTPGTATILVVLDASVFPYAHASGDGSDLRFGDDDPHDGFEHARWIERWTTTTSYVWVRANAATVGVNTIWAYYGATGAAVPNDFATVFPDTLRPADNAMLTGTLTHDAVIIDAMATINVMPGARLTINAAYMQIDGSLDANAAGHPAGTGPSTGGTSTNAGAGGAGYGGAGGMGGRDTGDNPGNGGMSNGMTEDEDVDLGSGGGTTDTSITDGRGGGGVRLSALRMLLDGTINANGEQGDGSLRSGGGGAGGGVLVRAQSLVFTGSISATGGRGGQGPDAANDGGGGGGGGRIKLFHRGDVVNTGMLSVTRGLGGGGGDVAPGQPGTDGTTFIGSSTTLPALPTIGIEQTL